MKLPIPPIIPRIQPNDWQQLNETLSSILRYILSLNEQLKSIDKSPEPIITTGKFLDNSPQATYVAWQNIVIYYRDKYYYITNGNTNQPYIYWVAGTSNFQSSNNFQNIIKEGYYLVMRNDGGIARFYELQSIIPLWYGDKA